MAEKGKSRRPIGGAPELGREGEEEEEEGGWGVIAREGGGKRGGDEDSGRRAIPFREVGGGGISWDSVSGGFGALCATQI